MLCQFNIYLQIIIIIIIIIITMIMMMMMMMTMMMMIYCRVSDKVRFFICNIYTINQL